MTGEEKHKLLDAVLGANRDNIMGGKYYKAYESGVINAYNRLVKAIKELEQGDAIDKIRDEIEKLNPVDYGSMYSYESHHGARDMKQDVLQIIDEYRKGGAE